MNTYRSLNCSNYYNCKQELKKKVQEEELENLITKYRKQALGNIR